MFVNVSLAMFLKCFFRFRHFGPLNPFKTGFYMITASVLKGLNLCFLKKNVYYVCLLVNAEKNVKFETSKMLVLEIN